MPLTWWMLWRLLVGPLAPAVLTGLELARYGIFTAAAAAYLVFAVSQATVVTWVRWQRRRARRRLDSLRNR